MLAQFCARTGMSDEDMNATPLGKLPPPIIQSKASMAPVDAPNYRDLLNDMDRSSAQGMPGSMPPGPGVQPLSPGPAMQSMQPMQPMQSMQSMQPMQTMQAMPSQMPQEYATQNTYMPPQQSYSPSYSPPYSPQYSPQYSPPYSADFEKPQTGGFLKRFLRDNRTTFVVVAIVFVTLLLVVPRLARMQRFGSVDHPGQLTMLGKLVAAAVAGTAYRVSLFAL